MTNNNLYDPRRIGTRAKFNRNRQIKYPEKSVLTDGSGNILDRPLTLRLRCFGDVVEWLMGRNDKPTQWHNQPPEPRGCALCPVSAFCATVVWERINSSAALLRLYEHWDIVNVSSPDSVRYTSPSWAALVDACNGMQWFDSNDAALEECQLAKAKTKSPRKPRKPRPRAVSAEVAQKIDEYRNARVVEMGILHISPNPPLWLRNRTYDRLVLLADVWQARETLIAENQKSTSGEILKWLKTRNLLTGNQPKGIVKRIEEALKRVDILLEIGEWPSFQTYPDIAQQSNHSFPQGLVYKILEP